MGKGASAPNAARDASPAKARRLSKEPPTKASSQPFLLLDADRMPFWLYLPNLIGYVRVIALVVAMMETDDPASQTALRAMVVSLGLDYIDGPIARRFNMCTKFGDLLDHYTDHISMFWLVYVTSAWPVNVFANFVHMAVACGYMAYYGCYFKHSGRPNAVCAVVEANNYFNMPALLWNANTVLIPFCKMAYKLEYGLPLKKAPELLNFFDALGLVVTLGYSIAVCIPGATKAKA